MMDVHDTPWQRIMFLPVMLIKIGINYLFDCIYQYRFSPSTLMDGMIFFANQGGEKTECLNSQALILWPGLYLTPAADGGRRNGYPPGLG